MDKIKLLKSDLKDCNDPKVLAKYPHLNNPKLIKEIETKIKFIKDEVVI